MRKLNLEESLPCPKFPRLCSWLESKVPCKSGLELFQGSQNMYFSLYLKKEHPKYENTLIAKPEISCLRKMTINNGINSKLTTCECMLNIDNQTKTLAAYSFNYWRPSACFPTKCLSLKILLGPLYLMERGEKKWYVLKHRRTLAELYGFLVKSTQKEASPNHLWPSYQVTKKKV